jgi:hypothetical protein
MTTEWTDPVTGYVRNDPEHHRFCVEYYLAQAPNTTNGITDPAQRATLHTLAGILQQLTRLADILAVGRTTTIDKENPACE